MKIIINSKRFFDLEDYDGEIWIDISNYENIYKISNYGRVKSIERRDGKNHFIKERILKCFLTKKNGYYAVKLFKNSKQKQYLNHRLTYMQFNNLNSVETIDHIDGNKYNNKLCNLQELTNKENVNKYNTIDKKRKEFKQKLMNCIDRK